MPGTPQARLSDMHTCTLTVGVPAPVTMGMPTVMVVKLPGSRITDPCAGVSPHPIAKASATVMIGKLPAARIGMDPCAGGGPVVPAQVTVLTGG